MKLDLGWFIARSSAGLIMAYYGSQKALGLFGGRGFGATVSGFEQNMGIPAAFGVLAILGEFLGGLGLLSGLMTRIAGFGVFCTMMVAMTVNIQKVGGLGVLANGTPDTVNGIFYTFLIGMVGLASCLSGGGQYSLDAKLGVDQKLFGWMKKKDVTGAND